MKIKEMKVILMKMKMDSKKMGMLVLSLSFFSLMMANTVFSFVVWRRLNLIEGLYTSVGRLAYGEVCPERVALPDDCRIAGVLHDASKTLSQQDLIRLLLWCKIRYASSASIQSIVADVAHEKKVFDEVEYLYMLYRDNKPKFGS